MNSNKSLSSFNIFCIKKQAAKQAVEIAIEEGEGKAFEFLNNYKNKTLSNIPKVY